MKNHTLIAALALLLGLVTACTSIDCPMNNMVYTSYALLNANGEPDTLKDTLSIVTNRRFPDQMPVLINKEYGATKLNVPISYDSPEDVFFFLFSNIITHNDTVYTSDTEYEIVTTRTPYVAIDTVTVSKTDFMHFESLDCNPSYFHTISGVKYTRNRIDSIVVNNKDVNYDFSKEQFHIYFGPRR